MSLPVGVAGGGRGGSRGGGDTAVEEDFLTVLGTLPRGLHRPEAVCIPEGKWFAIPLARHPCAAIRRFRCMRKAISRSSCWGAIVFHIAERQKKGGPPRACEELFPLQA